MSAPKTYLDVPYAQKDAAKALGARWDAANKKWYAPADKDLALFAQWHSQAAAPVLLSGTPNNSKPIASTTDKVSTGGFTRAADKNFVAYDGDAPPWD